MEDRDRENDTLRRGGNELDRENHNTRRTLLERGITSDLLRAHLAGQSCLLSFRVRGLLPATQQSAEFFSPVRNALVSVTVAKSRTSLDLSAASPETLSLA